jgi:hypothetical protein
MPACKVPCAYMGWIYRIEGVFSSISDKILPVKLIRHEVKRGRSFTWWQSPETACRSRQTGRLYRSQLLVFKHRPDFQIARPFLMRVTRTVKASFWVVAALLLPTHAFGETLLEVTRQRILESQNPIFGAGSTTFPTQSDTLSINQPIFRKDLIERFDRRRSVVQQAEFTPAGRRAGSADPHHRVLPVGAGCRRQPGAGTGRARSGGQGARRGPRETPQGAWAPSPTSTMPRPGMRSRRRARSRPANKLRDARQGLREITGKDDRERPVPARRLPLETPSPASVEPVGRVGAGPEPGPAGQDGSGRGGAPGDRTPARRPFPERSTCWSAATARMPAARCLVGGSNVETTDTIAAPDGADLRRRADQRRHPGGGVSPPEGPGGREAGAPRCRAR